MHSVEHPAVILSFFVALWIHSATSHIQHQYQENQVLKIAPNIVYWRNKERFICFKFKKKEMENKILWEKLVEELLLISLEILDLIDLVSFDQNSQIESVLHRADLIIYRYLLTKNFAKRMLQIGANHQDAWQWIDLKSKD